MINKIINYLKEEKNDKGVPVISDTPIENEGGKFANPFSPYSKKDFFSLSELAKRWKMQEEGIRKLAKLDNLTIFLFSLRDKQEYLKKDLIIEFSLRNKQEYLKKDLIIEYEKKQQKVVERIFESAIPVKYDNSTPLQKVINRLFTIKDKNDFYLELGEFLKRERKDRKLSRKLVAKELGVSHQQYKKYETGKNKIDLFKLKQVISILRL